MAESFLDSVRNAKSDIIEFDDILDRGLPGLPGRKKPTPIRQNPIPSTKNITLGVPKSKKRFRFGISPIIKSIKSKAESTLEPKESLSENIQRSTANLNLPNLNLTKGLPSVRTIDRDSKEVVAIPPDNFNKNGSFILTGEFPENQITFDKFSLSDLTITNKANFEFILKVVGGGATKWFVSQITYNRLKEEEANNSPFYSHELLKPSSIVTLDLRPIIANLETYKEIEENAGTGVVVEKNLFYTPSVGGIDYDSLLSYIDFIVDKPSKNYDERVLPVAELGRWVVNETRRIQINDSESPVKSVTISKDPKPIVVKDKKTNNVSTINPTPPKPTPPKPPKPTPPEPTPPLKPEDAPLGPALLSPIIKESRNNPDRIFPVSSTVNIKNGVVRESFYNPNSGIPFVNLPKIKINPIRFNSSGGINFTQTEKDNLQKSISNAVSNLKLDFSKIDFSQFGG